MQRLKRTPIFLILLSLFFCLHGYVENYGFIEVSELLQIGLIIFGFLAFFCLLLFLITRDAIYAGLIIFFIALLYLFFGAMHDWLKSISWLSFLHSYTVLLPVLALFSVGWIIYLKKNKSAHSKWSLYLNLLLLVYCLVDGIALIKKSTGPGNKKLNIAAVNFIQDSVKNKPNVYFLLFDEYPGYKTLADSFGFRNDELYHFLEEKKMSLLPTYTNYDLTLFSLSSIFNMQYVDSGYNQVKLSQSDQQERIGEIRNNRVMEIFRTMGYRIGNYSIFDIDGQPRVASRNSLFPVHAPLLTDKILHNRLIRDLAWWFVNGRFRMKSFREKFLYGKDTDNRYIEKMLKEVSAQKNSRPGFYYAHFLMPHRPFFRDSSGNRREFRFAAEMYELFYDREIFLGYLKYTNSVIRSLVETITKNDPGALLIVMSDHGFHTPYNMHHQTPNNYDHLCAIRLPGGIPPPVMESRSTVNLFRYLYNSYFNQRLPYLPDKTVWVNQ